MTREIRHHTPWGEFPKLIFYQQRGKVHKKKKKYTPSNAFYGNISARSSRSRHFRWGAPSKAYALSRQILDDIGSENSYIHPSGCAILLLICVVRYLGPKRATGKCLIQQLDCVGADRSTGIKAPAARATLRYKTSGVSSTGDRWGTI